MRRAALVAFASLAAAFGADVACDPAADVVARAVDAGEPADASEEDAALPPDAAPCGPVPTAFDVITKSGGIYSFDFTNGKTTDLSRPECKITSGAAIAVSNSGDVVIADEASSLFIATPGVAGCRQSLFVSVPSAMTFLYDPFTDHQQLYALLDTKLVTIDTGTFEVQTIAALSPAPTGTIKGLAGTAKGELVLFVQNDIETVISDVNRVSGAVTMITTVKAPDTQNAFVGAAPTATGFEMVFGTNVYAFSNADQVLTPAIALATTDTIMGVGSSSCAR